MRGRDLGGEWEVEMARKREVVEETVGSPLRVSCEPGGCAAYRIDAQKVCAYAYLLKSRPDNLCLQLCKDEIEHHLNKVHNKNRNCKILNNETVKADFSKP